MSKFALLNRVADPVFALGAKSEDNPYLDYISGSILWKETKKQTNTKKET